MHPLSAIKDQSAALARACRALLITLPVMGHAAEPSAAAVWAQLDAERDAIRLVGRPELQLALTGSRPVGARESLACCQKPMPSCMMPFANMLRWQVLGAVADGPGVTARVVKRADVGSVLPAAAARVTPQQRHQQLEQRAESFDRRFTER